MAFGAQPWQVWASLLHTWPATHSQGGSDGHANVWPLEQSFGLFSTPFISLAFGVVFNALFNTLVFLLIAAPLVFTWRDFEAAN